MRVKRLTLICYVIMMSVLLILGVWQLNRAEEKRMVLNLQAQQQNNLERYILNEHIAKTLKPLRYKTIQAIGSYDNQHQFLLDNQHYQNKVGYFVISPFRLQGSKQTLLVNRGWIPLGRSRTDLPNINVTEQTHILTGRVNDFPRIGLKLAGAEQPTQTSPSLLQIIDVRVVADHLKYPLLDMLIELDSKDEHGYVRDWQAASTMTPEKHIAYAVQWFLLAITLTVLFIKYGINKTNGSA